MTDNSQALRMLVFKNLTRAATSRFSDPHALHADPELEFDILADPDPWFEIFADPNPDPGLDFFKNKCFCYEKKKKEKRNMDPN